MKYQSIAFFIIDFIVDFYLRLFFSDEKHKDYADMIRLYDTPGVVQNDHGYYMFPDTNQSTNRVAVNNKIRVSNILLMK